jgi:hypothetical protein
MTIKKASRLSLKPRSVNKWERPNSPKVMAIYRGHLSLALLKPTLPKTTIMTQSIRFTKVIMSMPYASFLYVPLKLVKHDFLIGYWGAY